MNGGNVWAIVAVAAVCTFLTRALPFLLFGKRQHVPPVIVYLGRMLPPAVMVTLVVYSIKDISFSAPALWLNEILCILVTIAIHLWKKNALFSITAGTLFYMVLTQTSAFA